jgi:predicted Zn-dependent peptidase
VEKAIEVLGEMLTDSLLADNDIKTEKGVVLEEIKRGEDEPGDHVHDLHLDYRWPNHPIGRPVIGHAQAVSSFSRDDLVNYISRRYMGGRVVLSVAGNVDPAVVEGAAKKALSKLQPGGEVDTLPKEPGTPAKNEVAKDVEQVHFCIGTDGCTFYDEDRFPAIVCDGVLGSGMSSRLFQEVRERRGLAYAIGSYELTYRSAGAFTVYGGTGADKWEEVQAVVQGEFDKIAKSGVPDEGLERTKRMIAGNIVLALESMSSRMMRMARNEITFGREIPVMETVSKIEAVTNDQIVAFASQRLAADKISTTAIGPFK